MSEDWPPDDEPRQCRRWNNRTRSWQWKARYVTRDEAAAGAGKGMVLYVCSECGFWHRASAHRPARDDLDSPEAWAQIEAKEVRFWIAPGAVGLWCEACALPSVVEFTIQRDPADPPSSTWSRWCTDGRHSA